jgi:hypothetical protein
MIEMMQNLIDEYSNSNLTDIPTTWPEDIMPKINELFVSDFPMTKPDEKNEVYNANPSLEFALIEKNKTNFANAQQLFKNSKVYKWLKQQIIENKSDRDLGFGSLSQLIHDALADDPAPYRKDIKTLQANLYTYLKKYANDEIEIYVPGKKSEVIRLK